MFDPDASSDASHVPRRAPVKGHEDDLLYRQKREKNNEAVKKSREKKRRESEETSRSIEQLQAENDNLRRQAIVAEASWRTTKDIYEHLYGQLTPEEIDGLFRK